MTEKEAIEIFTDDQTCLGTTKCDAITWTKLNPAMETAINAMVEIQQYRTIGTVEECREAVERRRARKPEKELRNLENNHEIDCYGINELNNACARAADAIEALSAKMQAVNMETGSRWIAVEKRLPKNSQNVLAGFKNDCECVIAYYSEMDKKWTNSSTGWEITADVIAWQPLPKPYRSKPKEGNAYE